MSTSIYTSYTLGKNTNINISQVPPLMCFNQFFTFFQNSHEKFHTMEPQFKCTECTKAFIYKHQLVVHQRMHSGERPHRCDVCGAQFASQSQYKRHAKMQHNIESPPEEKLQNCPECNKIFRDKRLLANHRRIHTGIKPHKCEFCEKTFITQSDCKKHTRIHTGLYFVLCIAQSQKCKILIQTIRNFLLIGV